MQTTSHAAFNISSMRRFFLLKAISISLILWLVCACVPSRKTATFTAGPGGLFKQAAGEPGAKADPTILRERYVTIDFGLLPLAVRDLGSQPRLLSLNLFDDEVVTGVIDRVERNHTGGWNLIGQINGIEYSQLTLVVQDNLMAGVVRFHQKVYAVRYSGEADIHVLSEFDPSAFPDDAEAIPVKNPPQDLSRKPGGTKADDGSVIDVMVVYTSNARVTAGGTSGMQNLINLAISITNTSYANSLITQRLNLVHTAEVTYTETGDANTDIARLSDPSDGYMDDANTWRDTYAADIVTLIDDYDLAATDLCGLGYQMTIVSTSFESAAYNVVDDVCATAAFAYAHELGHNMGARHDWYVDTETVPYEYAHGYVYLVDQWRTVMAYRDECEDNGTACTQVPYWSNPNVTLNAVPMGVAEGQTNPANNASVLNNTAYTVANFRVSSTTTGDLYEPDDTSGQAGWIEDGVPQTHSIEPATDVDWVKFQLAETSAVTLATSGASSSDTRMWLYDGGLNQIGFDDDNGMGDYASIERYCGLDALPAGLYFVKVDEDGNNSTIPSYTLAYTSDQNCSQAAPEIEVTSGDSTVIPDGDTTPSIADGTDFGMLDVSGGVRYKAFYIWNEGTATLNLTGSPLVGIDGTHATDFFVFSQPSSATLVPGGDNLSFQVGFNAIATGVRTATIRIANNDSDENPYTFTIQGTGTGVDVPEIAVKNDVGVLIPDNDTSPSAADGTDFGSVDAISGAVVHTFQIWNDGGLALNLTGDPVVVIADNYDLDFTVTAQPSSTVVNPWGSFLEFEVTFDPIAVGERTATISIANDDSNENPYNFTISGMGTGTEFVEMVVRSHNTANLISNGDTTPSTEEGTDFGSLNVSVGVRRRNFRIENHGTMALNLTGNPLVEISGLHALDFAVNQPMYAAVDPGGGFVGFSVDFNPIATGVRTATISIANDDPDENPYTFTIQGTGTGAEAPEISVKNDSGVLISNQDDSPSEADGTDFGRVETSSGAVAHTFQIWNDGGAALSLIGTPIVEISGPHASDFTVTVQPSSSTVSPWGNYVTFEVVFDPIAIGERTASISVANDDSDENPYTFDIRGSGETRLITSDGGANDHFGSFVSISGDTAIVAAPLDDDNGSGSGAVYIFNSNAGTWTQTAKLFASDGAAGDRFGASVSISGDTAIVGAIWDDDNGDDSGSAYIFSYSAGTWTQTAKLLPSDGATGETFGTSVSISGDTAIVGAYLDDDNGMYSGSAYVFTNTAGTWAQTAKLLPSDGAEWEFFGASVSISGDTALVGAYLDDDNGPKSGSAYIFTNNAGTWTETTKLLPSDGGAGDHFGNSVSVSGDTAIVSAVWEETNGRRSGSAYIFTNSAGAWVQGAKLLPSDGKEYDSFGASVSISGDTAIVGAIWDKDNGRTSSGSVYIFVKPYTGWADMHESARLLPSDGATCHRYGYSVSVSGNTVLVGVYTDDDSGTNSGSVYLFNIQAYQTPGG